MSDNHTNDADVIPTWLIPGTVLCDRYTVSEHLGSGTVGRAFLCTDSHTDELVVVKVSKTPLGDNTLVLDEYRALRARLSPTLTFPIGYFVHSQEGHQWPVLVVDFVDGEPLSIWAQKVPVRARVAALAEISVALQILDSAHGDLWAPNVMVTKTGRVRLIDPDGDSLGRSSRLSGTRLQDAAGFCDLIRTLVPPPDDKALLPILKMLEHRVPPDYGAVASHLRAMLTHPLRSEVVGSVATLASAVATSRDTRQEKYRTLRDIRETEIMTLFDRIEGLMLALRCSTPPGQTQPIVDLYQSELSADAAPSGILHHRNRTYIAPDGEEFWISFESVPDFYKPWPYPAQIGLLSKGMANVRVDRMPIVTESLELWLQDDQPKLFVNEGTRSVPFDHSRLERLARLLVGVALPALPSPVFFTQPPAQHSSSFAELTPYVRRLGAEHSVELLPRNWLHVNLAYPPTRLRRTGDIGSKLFTIFDIPHPSRRALAKHVGEVISARAKGWLAHLYRLDITVLDEVSRTVEVLAEGRTIGAQNDFSWTLELDFPTTAAPTSKRPRKARAPSPS